MSRRPATWRKIAGALELRRARVPLGEIAKRFGVNPHTIEDWTRRERTVARVLRGDLLERARRLLARGRGSKWIARELGVSQGTIRNAIREGRIASRSTRVSVACSACGRRFRASRRTSNGAACSDRCRKALSNANKTMTRWRARGREISPTARALIVAQALLRLETIGGSDGY